MTPEQKEWVLKRAPNGMSVHQAAKWLLMTRIDADVAVEMEKRAAQGLKRLTA